VCAVIKVLPPFVEPVALFVEQPLSGCFAMLNRLGGVRGSSSTALTAS
jgi:hypothetical protein